MSVTVEGYGQVVRGLSATAALLTAPEFLAVGHASILPAARDRAPRATGRLAGSGRSDGTGITFTVPYAGPVHWGVPSRGIPARPFIVTGAERVPWADAMDSDLQDQLNAI